MPKNKKVIPPEIYMEPHKVIEKMVQKQKEFIDMIKEYEIKDLSMFYGYQLENM